MGRRLAGLVALAVASAITAPCLADHIIGTYPHWDGNVTSGWFAVAQSFVAPVHNTLDNYTFGFEVANVDIAFRIFEWDETSGPVGGTLYAANFVSAAGDNLVDNINLALTPGTMYAAIVDMRGYGEASVHWMTNVDGNPTGDASWFDGGSWQYLDSGWSTKFRAEFTGIPAPGAVALLGLAALTPRRRRRI